MDAYAIEDEFERADALKLQVMDYLPTLKSRAAETDALRQLKPETFADLKSIGLSRLCQPRKFGGAELPLDRAVDILSTIARECASTAWVCAVYTDHSILVNMFDDKAADDVWSNTPEATLSAGYQPTGRAERVADGWRLSGKWGFVSGCDDAGWFIFGAFVPGEAGAMVHHFFLVPRSDIEIEDNWHVLGLRGTGSKNVIVKDAIVPDYRVQSMPMINGGEEVRRKQPKRAFVLLIPDGRRRPFSYPT